MPDAYDKIINLPDRIAFAMAKTLTQLAKESEAKAIENIQRDLNLTPNNLWYLPSNKFGVRITPARPNNLTAEIRSDAHWLAALEQGERHVAESGHLLAVPTRDAKTLARDPSARRGLWAGAYIVKTKGDREFVFKRVNGKAVLLFVLKRSVPRPVKTPLTSAVKETVRARFEPMFKRNVIEAIATAR